MGFIFKFILLSFATEFVLKVIALMARNHKYFDEPGTFKYKFDSFLILASMAITVIVFFVLLFVIITSSL